MQATVQHRRRCRRHALQREDVAQPQALEHRKPQAADDARQVAERVRARIPVVGGIGQRTGATGVDDHDERATHAAPGPRNRSERLTGENTAWSTAWKIAGGA